MQVRSPTSPRKSGVAAALIMMVMIKINLAAPAKSSPPARTATKSREGKKRTYPVVLD